MKAAEIDPIPEIDQERAAGLKKLISRSFPRKWDHAKIRRCFQCCFLQLANPIPIPTPSADHSTTLPSTFLPLPIITLSSSFDPHIPICILKSASASGKRKGRAFDSDPPPLPKADIRSKRRRRGRSEIKRKVISSLRVRRR